MVHQAVVGYENYVYCHDCGIVKSQLSGKIIKPKNGMYHFFDGSKVVGIPQEQVYVYEVSTSANASAKRLVSLILILVLVMSIMLGWTTLIIAFCLNSTPD